MAKYKVKHTTILHNNTSCGEGSIIELTEAQAKKLADFVELVPETKSQNLNKQKQNKNNSKQKTETKNGAGTEKDDTTPDTNKGGTDGK